MLVNQTQIRPAQKRRHLKTQQTTNKRPKRQLNWQPIIRPNKWRRPTSTSRMYLHVFACIMNVFECIWKLPPGLSVNISYVRLPGTKVLIPHSTGFKSFGSKVWGYPHEPTHALPVTPKNREPQAATSRLKVSVMSYGKTGVDKWPTVNCNRCFSALSCALLKTVSYI